MMHFYNLTRPKAPSKAVKYQLKKVTNTLSDV